MHSKIHNINYYCLNFVYNLERQATLYYEKVQPLSACAWSQSDPCLSQISQDSAANDIESLRAKAEAVYIVEHEAAPLDTTYLSLKVYNRDVAREK